MNSRTRPMYQRPMPMLTNGLFAGIAVDTFARKFLGDHPPLATGLLFGVAVGAMLFAIYLLFYRGKPWE